MPVSTAAYLNLPFPRSRDRVSEQLTQDNKLNLSMTDKSNITKYTDTSGYSYSYPNKHGLSATTPISYISCHDNQSSMELANVNK